MKFQFDNLNETERQLLAQTVCELTNKEMGDIVDKATEDGNKYDIMLSVNGKEIDFFNFYKTLTKWYDYEVEEKAANRAPSDVNDKLHKLSNMISEIQRSLADVAVSAINELEEKHGCGWQTSADDWGD